MMLEREIENNLREVIKSERKNRKRAYIGAGVFGTILLIAGFVIPYNNAALNMGYGIVFATIVYALLDLLQPSAYF